MNCYLAILFEITLVELWFLPPILRISAVCSNVILYLNKANGCVDVPIKIKLAFVIHQKSPLDIIF